MNTILVTGGAGYIGSHTCQALASAGYRPVVLDDLSMGHRWAVKWGPLVQGDIANQSLVRRTVQKHHIDAVIHFAANALVGESMRNPYKYLQGNVRSSLDFLEALRGTRVRRIVFSSSCAVYGAPRRVPISEAEPTAPVNPYGESKLYVERALRWYERAHGFSWLALRYFNAAGADPAGEVGEAHAEETHLIPSAIEAALGRRPALEVMGTSYRTPDGTAIRDYVHVADLASAHVLGLGHLFRGHSDRIFNLGTAQGYSVREVIAAVEQATGRCVPVRDSAARPGDPPVLVADSGQARRVLGWQPRYTTLDAIVNSAWNWHASRTLTPVVAAAGR